MSGYARVGVGAAAAVIATAVVWLIEQRRRRRIGALRFPDGQGRMGDYYGENFDGKANGRGTWKCCDEGLYQPTCDATFVNNQLHGHGVKVWATGRYAGNRYEGGFARDRKHGHGTYTWANGESFEGTWNNGPRVGPGIYRFAGKEEARHFKPVLNGQRAIVVAAAAAIVARSGAGVVVDDMAPGQLMTPVALSGTRAEIDVALRLIDSALAGPPLCEAAPHPASSSSPEG